MVKKFVIHRYNIRNSKNIGPNSLLHFLPNVNDQGFAFLKISSSSYSFLLSIYLFFNLNQPIRLIVPNRLKSKQYDCMLYLLSRVKAHFESVQNKKSFSGIFVLAFHNTYLYLCLHECSMNLSKNTRKQLSIFSNSERNSI